MMKVLVVLCSLAVGAYAESITYTECGTNEYFTLKGVDLKDTITFPSTVRADVSATVNKDIPDGARLSLKVYRVVNIFGERHIKIPCIAKAGSCEYDLCEFIAKKKSGPKFDLCMLWPEDEPCGCPIKQGTIIDKQDVNLKFPALPSIAKLLASGKYLVKVELKDTEGHSLYCVDINARIG